MDSRRVSLPGPGIMLRVISRRLVRSLLPGVLFSTFLLAPASCFGAEKKPTIDKQTETVLRKVAAWLQKQQQLSCMVTMTMEMKSQGMENRTTTRQVFAVDRPTNRFAMITKEGFPKIDVVCDGKKVYTFISLTNSYTEKPAPKNLEQLLTENPLLAGNAAPGLSPALFLKSDPYAALTAGVTSASYVGKETINGTDCHRVRLSTTEADIDLWIRVNDPPLLIRMAPDMQKFLKKMRNAAPGLKKMTMSVVVDTSEWSFGKPLPDDLFVFKPPPDATKKASLFEQPEQHPLVGENAPDFTLDLLDGGQVHLTDHLGKHVVVLDFWATWCPPCRRALPILARVTAAKKQDGVVFYAVDQGETPEKVRRFLKDRKIQCAVALDRDRKVGRKYKVSGIPQTVIIGKNGRIESVHVGFNPALEDELGKQLDTLIKGGSLIESQAPKP